MYAEALAWGNGFGGLCRYVMSKPGAVVLGGNMPQGETPMETARLMATEFRAIADENRRIKKPVMHLVAAWHPQDQLDDAAMEEAAERMLDAAGMDTDLHQYAVVRHIDTDHQHLHIIANRVGFEGDPFYGQFIGQRVRREADRMEQQYGWTPAVPIGDREPGAAYSASVAPQDRALEKQAERTGVRGAKHAVYRGVATAVHQCDGSWESFDAALREQGVAGSFSFRRDGSFNGASFTWLDDSGQPRLNPEGESYTFRGAHIKWKRDRLLGALADRREGGQGPSVASGPGLDPQPEGPPLLGAVKRVVPPPAPATPAAPMAAPDPGPIQHHPDGKLELRSISQGLRAAFAEQLAQLDAEEQGNATTAERPGGGPRRPSPKERKQALRRKGEAPSPRQQRARGGGIPLNRLLRAALTGHGPQERYLIGQHMGRRHRPHDHYQSTLPPGEIARLLGLFSPRMPSKREMDQLRQQRRRRGTTLF